MTAPPLFDRALLRRRRDRAARRRATAVRDPEFLRDAAAAELLDRMASISRDFALGVELGGAGAFARAWSGDAAGRAKLAWLASTDLSAALLGTLPGTPPAARAVIDEERLAFKDGAVDLIVAPLSLHWVDDLPGALIQIRRALKPDGVFLGALLGGATLTELRACLIAAESEVTSGAAARVSPFTDVLDAAGLLQRAGFALPVADRDTLAVDYPDPLALLHDLRAMGETSALLDRPRRLRRAVLARAFELYGERFPAPGGRVRATFEIVYLTGWAPHPDQPTPKRPGSATTRLADALGATERSAGERAGE